MAIDGYFINGQIKEFQPILENGKLRRIISQDKYQVIFEIFNNGKTYKLLFDVSPNSSHFRLVNDTLKAVDSAFVESLKRVLLNSTLNVISQYKKDRIIYFDFTKRDPFTGEVNYRLIFELMGRNANLILVDSNNIILDAFNKRFNENKRSIIPNAVYEEFPTTKKEFKAEDLKEIESPLILFKNYLGFSKDLAEYIYLTKKDPLKLEFNPTLYQGIKKSFHIYDLYLEGKKTSFKDSSSLLEAYYDLTIKSDDYVITVLNKELRKQTSKLTKLNQDLENNSSYEKYKELADLIYSSGLNLNQRYSEFNNISIDSKISLNENAQKLYKKYKKLRSSIDYINEQIKITNEVIEYLNDTVNNFSQLSLNEVEYLKEELIDLGIIKKKSKKKAKQQKAIKYLEYKLDNAICFVGKTLKQNEYIYSIKASRDDLWFHVKDYPGAHVILKGEHSKENITFACRQAVINSSLKTQQSAEVVYTEVKYTKRIKNKIGFYVSYSNEKSVNISTK